MHTLRSTVEIRESESGPTLHATVLQEGRAARGGRAELFAPGSVVWPADGIEIRTRHLGPAEARAVPVRQPNGEIRISVPASPAMVQAVSEGRDAMSVEFHALREIRTAGGVREIERALVDGASLTDDPEYSQTAAEVRFETEGSRMAVTLQIGALATALRITAAETATIPAGQLSVLTRALSAATGMVTDYAPDAPGCGRERSRDQAGQSLVRPVRQRIAGRKPVRRQRRCRVALTVPGSQGEDTERSGDSSGRDPVDPYTG